MGRSERNGLADPQAILRFQEVVHWGGMVGSAQQCSVLIAECSDGVGGMSPFTLCLIDPSFFYLEATFALAGSPFQKIKKVVVGRL